MAKFEFEVVFALPDGEFDVLDLSNAFFEAGFEDAVVGLGQRGLVAVALELEGDDAEKVIVSAARDILKHLPPGSALREVRPDLVSLAEVAKRLHIKRQALQKRRMPAPALCGHYRVTEIAEAITEAKTAGCRKARFDVHVADSWFAAGRGAQIVNARIALGQVDPFSLEYNEKSGIPEVYQASAGT